MTQGAQSDDIKRLAHGVVTLSETKRSSLHSDTTWNCSALFVPEGRMKGVRSCTAWGGGPLEDSE